MHKTMKGISLMNRLAQTLYAEHEMKCDLLECEPPNHGEHTQQTCSICDLIAEGKRQAGLFSQIAKEMKATSKS